MIGKLKSAKLVVIPFVYLGVALTLVAPQAVRAQGATSTPAPVHLSCDSMQNPLGIDVLHPRLSWQQPEVGRNIRQNAYEILVSTQPDAEATPDVWDSGRIASDASVDVAYAGPALKSTQRYYWRVRVWNRDSRSSAYSAPAWWEMGLLSPGDWHGQWIAYDPQVYRDDRKSDPKWIWMPGEQALTNPNSGNHQFRLTFNLSQVPSDATLFITGKETVAVWLNGEPVLAAQEPGPWGALYTWGPFKVLPVGKFLKSGNNVLAAQVFVGGKNDPAGLIALLRIRMPDGSVRRLVTNPDWKAAIDPSGDWFAPNFNDASWQKAVVAAPIGEAPLGNPWPAKAADLLRHTFSISKPVRSARVYITSLGSYQLHLNGKRIGNQILAPGWTDYRKQVVYQTYDVTANLHQGENAIGALLGDGWYATGLVYFHQRYNFGPPPTRLLAQLEITCTDGSQQTVVTDGDWKATPSAVQSSGIYDGEIYDARLQKAGWDEPSYGDAGWIPATIEPAAKGQLTGQNFQPIRIEKTLRPVSVSNPKPGTYVFDMGQNMVGWERLHVQGPRDTKVTMQFGEVLKDGQFYRLNMRTAKEADTYTLSGEGEEIYQPHFTYHGFRYVEITGYPGTPTLDSIQGVVFHTDAPSSIQFHTGSPMVNQLWSNILWGQRGNFMSVPTDCPQRDERLGWMGDAEVFWRTAAYNMNLDAFSHKFTRDIREAQSPEGGYTDISPNVANMGNSSPGWADAGVIIPWTTYVQYGDTSIIRENWPAMQRWMDHVQEANPDNLWLHQQGNNFGDWLAIGSVTSKDLIATAYWAYDASLMSQMAAAVNKPQDAERYRQLFEHIRIAFDHAYVKPDGTVGNGSQTSYVLALHMQLIPKELRPLAANKLVADIKAHQWHLTTGFLGTPYIMIELSNSGHSDVAYRLLLNTSFPSWGYMIQHGATTMWERWNGNQMLNDPGMNSFNHYAYGAVGEWLYRYAAGIDENVVDGPGFHRIVLHPQFNATLGEAGATYDSAYGPITSAWKYAGKGIAWHVVIPSNTTALLRFPTARRNAILEADKPLGKSLKLESRKDGFSYYTVESGTYDFTVKQ
jgi:alpha-L-rhamnosidase